MSAVLFFNLAIFIAIIALLIKTKKLELSLSKQVLVAVVAGVLYGLALQFVYTTAGSTTVSDTLAWTDIVGGGYVSLLKMIIMPLILVSMISAVVKIKEISALGKIGAMVIGILIFTTMIAALVGIAVTSVFELSAEGLTRGARELTREGELLSRIDQVTDVGFAQVIVKFLPTNIFADLTGSRPTSIISVVIFSILFGICALQVGRENAKYEQSIIHFIEILQAIVMKLVRLVLALTPFGVLALMANVVASSSWVDILNLLGFIAASYVAILIMFIVHGMLLLLVGIAPTAYLSKVWPVLTFAFVSRSSAATIPLNVQTQIEKLHVSAPIANLSATFGSTIGQNGCAGIYPAMLAVMIASSQGIPIDMSFVLSLVTIVVISSFGIAGVGGGATFAALIVLPAMGLPVALAALLISIEPLIDMARTALNVNGAMTAGCITQRWLGKLALGSVEVKNETPA